MHQPEVDGEQQRAADVAEGPAAAGDGVPLVGPGQVGQPRVVDDRRGAEADVGDDEQDGGQQPPAVAGEEQRRWSRARPGTRSRRASRACGRCGRRSAPVSGSTSTCRRPTPTARRRTSCRRRCDRPRNDSRSSGPAASSRDRGEVRAEEDGRHRGVEDRHRPVVGVPAEALALQLPVDRGIGGHGSGVRRRSRHGRRFSAAGRPVQHRRSRPRCPASREAQGRRPEPHHRGTRRRRSWAGSGRRGRPVGARRRAAGRARG